MEWNETIRSFYSLSLPLFPSFLLSSPLPPQSRNEKKIYFHCTCSLLTARIKRMRMSAGNNSTPFHFVHIVLFINYEFFVAVVFSLSLIPRQLLFCCHSIPFFRVLRINWYLLRVLASIAIEGNRKKHNWFEWIAIEVLESHRYHPICHISNRYELYVFVHIRPNIMIFAHKLHQTIFGFVIMSKQNIPFIALGVYWGKWWIEKKGDQFAQVYATMNLNPNKSMWMTLICKQSSVISVCIRSTRVELNSQFRKIFINCKILSLPHWENFSCNTKGYYVVSHNATNCVWRDMKITHLIEWCVAKFI